MKVSAVLFLFLIIWCSTTLSIPDRACSTPDTKKYPFCDPSLDIDTRVKDLISRLMDAEKPLLLNAEPKINLTRLGVPDFDWGLMCGHGVQSQCGSSCPTSFPNPNNMGASWNMSLANQMAAIIGLELRALWLEMVHEYGVNVPVGLVCRSPNININRDPRWGRNVEVPSEDPLITSRFAVEWTKGIQEGFLDKRYIQALVTIKHYAAYSLDLVGNVTRHNFNAIVSNYDLANTYFPAFKAAVMEADAKGVECSYNSVNGIPACANIFLLNDTLRNAWGFDGYVTSDQQALTDVYVGHHYVSSEVDSAAISLHAGTDLDYGVVFQRSLGTAVQMGMVTPEEVDKALYRTLKLRFQLGLFDPIDDQPYWHIPPIVINTPHSQAFNLFAAQQGIVLLKNDNKCLPFPKGKKVAVVGPHYNATEDLVGNYLGQICPKRNDYSCVTGIFQAIQEYNQNGVTTYAQGCTVTDMDKSGFAKAIEVAGNADYIVLMLGLNMVVEHEALDRTNIVLPGVQSEFSQEIIKLNKPTAVVLLNGGTISIEWLSINAPAIVEAFYPGYAGSRAIASALFGDYNPGGKLPVTVYPSNYINQISMLDMSMTSGPGRSYKYYKGTPLWPFGWGLSYTQFKLQWSNGIHSVQTMTNQFMEMVTFSVNVTNIGDVAGDEVVQAYFQPKDPLVVKQLFDFQRVHLKVGQSVNVTFQLNYKTFMIGDENGNFVSIPGEYPIEFSNGVHEKLNGIVKLSGTPKIVETFKK